MTRQHWILVGGGVAAVMILKSKKGATNPLSKLLKKITPTPPKQVPRPSTTNLATGYGTRTVPVGPSSGIGYNPTGGTNRAGATMTPTQAGIAAGIPVLSRILGGIFGKPATTPTTTKQNRPAQTTPPKSQAGGGTGGPTGGTGTNGMPGAPSRGGMIGDRSDNYGFYDERGNWVKTDADGNIVPDASGNPPGYYDADGNYVSYADQFVGPINDDPNTFVGPVNNDPNAFVGPINDDPNAFVGPTLPVDGSGDAALDVPDLGPVDPGWFGDTGTDDAGSFTIPNDIVSPDTVSIPDLGAVDPGSFDSVGDTSALDNYYASSDYIGGNDQPDGSTQEDWMSE